MFTSQGFRNAINIVSDRMASTEISNARKLIALGQPFSRAQYFAGGPVVTRVVVPESWRKGELWSRIETVNAVLPEHQEAA